MRPGRTSPRPEPPRTCDDPPVSRIALLAHGAGSCPETALRLLGPAVPHGVRGRRDRRPRQRRRRRRPGSTTRPAGTTSCSSAASRSARTRPRCGRRPRAAASELLLVMPAWSGAPDDVAALTRRDRGRRRDVRHRPRCWPRSQPSPGDDWVLDELRRGWRTYDDVLLAATLRAAASSPGPTPEALAGHHRADGGRRAGRRPAAPRDGGSVLGRARAGRASRGGAVAHEPRDDRGILGRTGRRLLDAAGNR